MTTSSNTNINDIFNYLVTLLARTRVCALLPTFPDLRICHRYTWYTLHRYTCNQVHLQFGFGLGPAIYHRYKKQLQFGFGFWHTG